MANSHATTPKNRAKSVAVLSNAAFREMNRLWQAKEIVQLAAFASPGCVSANQEEPPIKQALEHAAEMIQTSIEFLCSLQEDIPNNSERTEVAHVS